MSFFQAHVSKFDWWEGQHLYGWSRAAFSLATPLLINKISTSVAGLKSIPEVAIHGLITKV